MENKKPKIYVILVTYNSEKYLKECLDSLKKQTYKNFEIILVDNNSPDKSSKLAKKILPDIKIIKNKDNLGFAGGNNSGIREAFKNKKTKYIVCLNIDTKVEKNWLKELVFVIENHKNIGSVQSKVLLYDKPDKINTSGNDINFLGVGMCGSYLKNSRTENKIKQISYASGSSVLYSKKALNEVGLYDEDYFMYKEDLDLGWRLNLFGYENLLAPKSVVYHKYHFLKNKNKFYYIERNRLITLLKNYKLKTLLLVLPIGILFESGMILYSIAGGFFKEKLKGYLSFIINLPKTISKRGKIQKNRKIKDSKIANKFVAKIEFEEINNPILKKIANPMLESYWKFIRGFI